MPCAPRMAGCRASCLHRQLVQEYRLARHHAETVREAKTGAYPAEVAQYGQLVTFKDWLCAMAGRSASRDEAAA